MAKTDIDFGIQLLWIKMQSLLVSHVGWCARANPLEAVIQSQKLLNFNITIINSGKNSTIKIKN